MFQLLLTTLTTIAGLLPLTYGIGGHDIYMGPMAMSLTYGLLFATPITLILVPSLYMIGYDMKYVLERMQNKRWTSVRRLQTEASLSQVTNQ